MDLQKWAENKVSELTETGKSFLDEGWKLDEVINYLRKSTTLGHKYWPQVVENVTNYANS